MLSARKTGARGIDPEFSLILQNTSEIAKEIKKKDGLDAASLLWSSLDDFQKLKEYHDRFLKEKVALEQKMRVEKARRIMALKAKNTEEAKETEREIAGLDSEIKELEKSLQETSPIVAVFRQVWPYAKKMNLNADDLPLWSGYSDSR